MKWIMKRNTFHVCLYTIMGVVVFLILNFIGMTFFYNEPTPDVDGIACEACGGFHDANEYIGGKIPPCIRDNQYKIQDEREGSGEGNINGI